MLQGQLAVAPDDTTYNLLLKYWLSSPRVNVEVDHFLKCAPLASLWVYLLRSDLPS